MVRLVDHIQAESVIFDFDGVIVDTEPLHYHAFQMVLEPLGLGFSWESYCETYMGFDDRDAFIEAHAAGGKSLTSDELRLLIDKKAAMFLDVVKGGVKSYPGVVDLINNLKRQQIPIAICSGALRSDIMPILAMLEIECFDVVITAEDVSRSKPDPECYRLAFSKIKECYGQSITSPALSVAIEDTPAGIRSAKDAGLKVIAVSNSYPSDKLESADSITDSLTHLIP